MLQEGKTFAGIGLQRGFYPMHILEEIQHSGGGIMKFYHSYLSFLLFSVDAFLLRTIGYTTARVSAFCYFYDWINKDPRRVARPDAYVTAGISAGLVAGVLSNPFEIVYTRMQADQMYPTQCRRNYKNFLDGLFKVTQEGALMRGALANGCKLAALCSSMTNIFDWCKENSYFFFGPHWLNRLWATASAVTVGFLTSMPFDTIRTRMHT